MGITLVQLLGRFTKPTDKTSVNLSNFTKRRNLPEIRSFCRMSLLWVSDHSEPYIISNKQDIKPKLCRIRCVYSVKFPSLPLQNISLFLTFIYVGNFYPCSVTYNLSRHPVYPISGIFFSNVPKHQVVRQNPIH